MQELISSLRECILFKGFTEEEIGEMLKNISHRTTDYSKEEIVAFEGEPINGIGVVIDGLIEVQKTYPSGKVITINKMCKGGIFGEVIIFSKLSSYPSTIISSSKSKIMFIPKGDIIKLFSMNIAFLNKFMSLLSNKILMLNKKLRELSYGTIREKIADYLLEEYKKQKKLDIVIEHNRNEMAEYFGVTRPSLSRELINLRKDGFIEFNKNIISIKNLDGLEDILF